MVTHSDLAGLKIERSAPQPRRPRRVRRIVGFGALGLTAVAFLAVLSLRDSTLEVRFAAASARGGAGGGLTANGYVVARTKASISSKVPGRLARLSVEEGDHVRAGEVIGWLEAADYQAALRQAEGEVLGAQATQLEAEARLAQARRAHERARALSEGNLLAAEAVEDAATAEDAAAAQLSAAAARLEAARGGAAQARASFDNTRIRAPFDGTVLRKDAEVGEVVAPAVAGGGLTRGAVITMADLTTLEVEVDVNEAYIAEIRRAQPASIVLDAYPSESFPGHVRQIVPTADRQKATVLVRVAIDSADSRILPEMGGRVVFLASAEAGPARSPATRRVFVPAAAVRNEAGTDYVWVVRGDGTVTRREVEGGPVTGEEREIRHGLRGDETLVLDPPEGLTEGQLVKQANGKRN